MLHVITHSRAARTNGNPHDLAGTELYVGGCSQRYTPSMCISHMKTRSPRLSLLTSSSDEPDT